MADMLLHPDVRTNAISFLQSLSNLQYQEKCWVQRLCPPGVAEDSFGMAIHFFFDDAEFWSAPHKQIGYSMRDEIEANLIHDLCNRIDIILDKYGTEKSDSFYIKAAEWQSVVHAAKLALDLLQGNDATMAATP